MSLAGVPLTDAELKFIRRELLAPGDRLYRIQARGPAL